MASKRVDIKAIVADERLRKRMMTRAIVFVQAVEGRDLTPDEAEAVYDRVRKERP